MTTVDVVRQHWHYWQYRATVCKAKGRVWAA